MFSRKKEEKRSAGGNKRGGKLEDFGLLGVAPVDDFGVGIKPQEDGDDDDEDLEAELLSLIGGDDEIVTKPKRAPPKPVKNLDKMVDACMADDAAAGEEDVDEDDPDLLAELAELIPGDESSEAATPTSPVKPPTPKPVDTKTNFVGPTPVAAGHSVLALLEERITNYEQARANALVSGDNSRARRFARGLKTLEQMKKSVKSGRAIEEEDIPPTVLIKASPEHKIPKETETSDANEKPKEPEPSITFPDSDKIMQNIQVPFPPSIPDPCMSPTKPESRREVGPTLSMGSTINLLNDRHQQYKMAALNAKKAGDKETAIAYMRIMKHLQPLIVAANKGEPIDIDSIPKEPGSVTESNLVKETVSKQPSVDVVKESVQTQPEQESSEETLTTKEALEKRMEKYVEQRDKAKNEGNSRKVRMNERIIKQYQDSLKAHICGRHVDFSELPTPHGFSPIPLNTPAPMPTTPTSQPSAAPVPSKSDSNTPSPNNTNNAQTSSTSPQQAPTTPVAKPPPVNVRKTPQSRVEKQLAFLVKRQQQFKKAALEAKKKGEIEQAKEYLRNAKGLDQLIEASKGGLPVDLNTVPIAPQDQVAPADVDFEVVNADDCIVAPPKTDADVSLIYTKLEEDLIQQIKMCAQTREHFKAIGDVASANRFEQLILHTKKDLDAVRAGFKRGSMPPQFHYEMRSFNIIQCNTDLNDNDCEVTVIRGINYNVPNPNEVDTYVRIEFPYPTDYPPQDKSEIVKDTNNPEYNHKSLFSIERKSRAIARLFKRHGIKIELYAKGGWFSRSTLIGSVKVPLVELETKCTLHDSFNVVDDRKKIVGGKVEVKVRLRNPVSSKELKKVTEKWLVIDKF